MGFEKIAEIIEIVLTLIGLILVIFGWIVPYRQSVRIKYQQNQFEQEMLKKKWEKELVDAQISKLYGPIAELTRESSIIFELVIKQIGHSPVFRTIYDRNEQCYRLERLNELPEEEQKIWVHFIENYSLPIQEKILDIIQKNQHLVYKSTVPECFHLYMNYVLGWRLLHAQMKNNVPNEYEYYYEYNYPVEFNTYIEKTLLLLQKRQDELIGF